MSISLRRNSSAIRTCISRFFALLLLLLVGGGFGKAQAAVSLVQHTSKDAGSTTTSTLPFAGANTAGNFVAVAIRGGLSSSQVFTVTDSNGNTYKKAAQIGFTVSAVTGAVFYAENIKGGADTVTVSMTVSGPLRFAISEYSGIATANSLDAFATATGVGTAVSSGSATTTVAGDLLFGTASTADAATWTAGTGYAIRDQVPAPPNAKFITEDQVQSGAGTAAATATLAASGNWGVVLAAFKPAGGVAGTPTTITATAGTPQNATVGTAFGVQLQATVKDSFNNPVSGATVTFAAPGSGASGTFAGGVNTATTNASGVASAAIFTANNIAGAYIVSASVSGVNTPANFSLTNLAGAAAGITATAGTPQSATVNTAFAAQLQATVKDSFGNPVSGVTVTFTAPGSGASGTFAGGVNTATTNASGVATAAAFTANATAGGPYLVTASASGAGSINFSLTNLAGTAASIAATAGTPQNATINTAFAVQLQATVTDSFNNPVSNVTVTFNAPASGASGTFAGGVKTATTNAQGVATAAVFTANGTAGSYAVTASVSGVASPANFSLMNLAGAAASITATAGTPQSATINTAFATQLQATVKDSGGNPVSGVTVTFTAPGSGASGAFAGGVNTATTNASGVATAAIFTANATTGTYTVTATVSGVASPANFSLTNLGNPPANIVASAGTPQSATISTAFAMQLQVTVTDSGNNPVSGVTVTFAAPGSGASGTFAGGVSTATTNASGVATAAVFTANSTAGSYAVTASVSGVASPANFSLTNLAGAAASITATAGTPQSATINTAFATQLQATVKDSGNNPVSGVTVTFTAPASGASGTFAGGVTTATTNGLGVATSTVFTANSTAGAFAVTASVSGVATAANFSLTNLPGAAASIAATAGTSQSAPVNTAFTTQLQVTVKDASNNPVSGVTVTFTVPASGPSGTFAGGVNTATTNAQGVATAAVFTANNSVGGPYTVTASVSGVASPANFSLTNLAGTPASIAATAGTPQSATINTAYSTQFQATVRDAGNNPLSGITVTFTAPASGASGTFAGGVTTATTNSLGVATSAVFSANGTAGTYTITASVSGVGSPANFSLTNLAGPAASITATAGTPQSATVNTAFAAQLQATVLDASNNPVSGVIVTFTAPGSGASGTFAGGVNTATTNASGVATASVFTANAVAGGPYAVTAGFSGVANPANFSLTNTASVAANILLVQHTSQDAGTTTSTSIAFKSSNTAGNFIAVCIRAGISSSQVFTVTDSNGNTYRQASQVGFTAAGVTMAVYYAENIKAGANTVTVADTVAGPIRTAILEYSGVATSNSKDVAVAATGTSTSPNSGNATTTANGDLLLGAVGTTNGATFTAGPGYKIEELVPVTPNPKLIAEDQILTSAGTASASATIAATDTWGAILAAFKAAGGGGGSTPTITSLSQTSGAVGVSITITGTNFGATTGTVTFNSTAATPSNWSGTSIIVPVPAGATTGPVVVTVNGVQSNGVTFTVVPAPSISGISPASGPPGASVTISGANFGSSQGSSAVTFSGINAGAATSWSTTSIVIPVPNGAITGPVVVTVLSSSSNGVTFTVTASGPSISGLTLTQGPVGATFTVQGSNFGSPQGSSTVTLSGAPMSAANWTATSFDVTVPSGAVSGPVVVTVGGVQSNGVNFTVTPPPAITSIAPTSGPIGTNVVITGTNFGPTVGTIQSFVTFNGIQTRASNWSNTSITAPVPTGATTGNVIVTVGGIQSNGVTFTVTPAPSITTLTPNFGPTGTSVTIAGANFGASQGTSTVTFNGVNAGTATTWSATSITIPAPNGATSGPVVVTESGVQSNGVSFTVTSGSGTVSLVQHRSLDAGTTTSGTLAFASNNTAGNWIAVAVRAGSTTSETFTITDTNGNTYHQAYQFATSPSAIVFALYYAENIKGGANTISITDTVSGPFRFAIFEYSGVAASNSIDAVPVIAQGQSASASSGNLTTATNGDLLLGTVVTPNADTFTAGTGYVIEESVPSASGAKLIVEDQIQTTAGAVSATATVSPSDEWAVGLAAFRSIAGAAPPITVTVSPTSASIASGYGTQAFTAATTNDFQSKGVSWALSGPGCSGVTCGTLSRVTTTSVTYNAPQNVPSPATVTLTATSIADTTKSSSATITVTQGVLTIVLSPKRAAVTQSASQAIQFMDTVFNDPQNLGVTWQVDGNNGGNSTTGTVSAAGLFTPGTQPGLHTVTAVSNANASVTASAPVAVTDLTGVYTHHNDVARTGQNIQEYGLTPSLVNSSTFGEIFSCPVDGYVYAQPLWVANLNISGGVHNVVFVATEHDSVYAFDADSPSCVQYWKMSFLGPNVTTLTPSDLNGNGDIVPEIGVTSTPVIDPSTNTIYVVPKTRETAGTVSGHACTTASPCYVHRLHALDLTTGAEKTAFNSPVVITATNFVPAKHLQRPALLLANNTVYIAFSSHGDQCNYQGWLMGYNASTLAQVFADPLTQAGSTAGCQRGGVWQAGAGPAADPSGNVYVETGNGTYDGTANFSDSAIKLSPTGTILDWFTPFDQNLLSANDIDMASGGMTILPASVGSSTHQNLAIATGKVAILFLLDVGPIPNGQTTAMGRFNPCACSNNDVQEVVPVPPPNTTLLDGGNYGNIAYWNGNIYTTGQNFPLSQFTIANGVIATPQASKSANTFPPRGGVPAVSASGTAGGVVWVIDYTGWQNGTAAILDAYDATNVGTLLYSSPVSGAGAAGPAVKFTVPTVANGRVYVGSQLFFTVYGLLPN